MSVLGTVHAVRATDLVIRFAIRLSAEAERVLQCDMTPPAYYHALREAGLEVDARKVLACGMPKRRALWWGCLCAWDGLREKGTEHELAAVDAVVEYVRRPGDALRRKAREARRGGRKASPAYSLASAAFFSAGSISTPGNPPVPAPDHLTGRLVAVSVYLAAAVREPRRYRTHLRHYLALGEEIAQGRHLWSVADAASIGEFAHDARSAIEGNNPVGRNNRRAVPAAPETTLGLHCTTSPQSRSARSGLRPHTPTLAASATEEGAVLGCGCGQHKIQSA